MIGTVVAAALWAIVASLVLSAVLGLAVALTIRLVRPAASTRQALWSVALGAAGFAPVAILAVMLVRGALPDATPLPPAATSAPAQAPDGAATGVIAAPGAGHAALVLPEPPAIAPVAARVIIGVWVLGALAGLIGLGRSLLRVRALKLRSSGLEGDLATELPWLTESPGREIYLRLSYETETPIAVGFRRPVVLIPTEMATAAGLTAIEPLVMHEYAHLARYDDWTNLAQRTIERVFWFNPLVWIIGRRVALEREVAADEAVVERTHDAKNYASTLWRMAQEMRMPEHVVVAPGAMLTRKQISVRIERLLEDGPLGRRFGAAAFAASLVALCAVAAVAATAPPIVLADDTSPLAVQRATAHAIAKRIVTTQAGAIHAAAAHVAAAIAVARKMVAQNMPMSPALPPIPAVHDAEAKPSGKRWLSREAVAGCTGCDFSRHDLRGLDLSGISLTGDDFSHANLDGVNLAGSTLNGVSFAHAQLTRANFRSANLTGVDFAHANLAGADLTDASLIGVDLSEATMDGAITTGIRLTGSELP